MPMLALPKPTRGELEHIEKEMRLEALQTGKTPKPVQDAKGHDAIQSAWRGEALRYWYLLKQQERINRR